MSICLVVVWLCCAKTAERIEMLFGLFVLEMYRIGISTIRPKPDSGQIVESAVRLELEFTGYRLLT